MGHFFVGRQAGASSRRHMSGRQILLFVGLVIALVAAGVIVGGSPYGWLFYVVAAGLSGLAAGIAWESRGAARLVAENE